MPEQEEAAESRTPEKNMNSPEWQSVENAEGC